MAYRHADWLILWEVDRYFDLTSAQKASLDRTLATTLARHRAEALPTYETFLSQVRDRVRAGLTREDVDWAFATYQTLRADLFERIVSDGGMFLASVSDEQVRYFETAIQKDHQKRVKAVKADSDERLAKRAADTVELAEDWLGPLTAEQKKHMTQLSLAVPDLQAQWLDYQWQTQQEAIATLRSKPTAAELSVRLREWLVHSERRAPPSYRQALADMRTALKELILSIDHIATPRQRAHVVAKLQNLIETIHQLKVS
jgi:hypothetical protein